MRTTIAYNEILKALNLWASKELSCKHIKHKPGNEFIQYLNYANKLITPKLRKISISKNFCISENNKTGFQLLVNKLEQGQDVNSHLSKLTGNAEYIDYLLDGYGIKHFHLGIAEKDNFVERTGELALAFVTEDEIFFITSKGHGDDTWYGKDVLEIIHEERPDLIEHAKVKGICGIEPKITSVEDIKYCRQNQLSIAIELDDGTVYFQNDLGTTLAGYSSAHTWEQSMIIDSITHHINTKLLYNIHKIVHTIDIKINKFIPQKEIAGEFIFEFIRENKLAKGKLPFLLEKRKQNQ
ncbi:TPA: hypothetical protein PXE99_001131 [Mannheimia haemolytica]|nr:hypothetical protein [Mannheimia haemolytica]